MEGAGGRVGDGLDVWKQRGEITLRSDGKAWTRCPPDSPPSAGPAAPVVFQERDAQWGEGAERGGGGRAGVGGRRERRGEGCLLLSVTQENLRGRAEAEQGLCEVAEGCRRGVGAIGHESAVAKKGK